MSEVVMYDGLPVLTKYVSASEGAEMAGVSRQLLHSHRFDFKTGCWISKRLHFERWEIEKWIEDRSAGLVTRPGVAPGTRRKRTKKTVERELGDPPVPMASELVTVS